MYLYGYANCNPRSAREENRAVARWARGLQAGIADFRGPATRNTDSPTSPFPCGPQPHGATLGIPRHTYPSGALHQNPHLEPRFPDARRGVGRICSIV